MPRVNNKRKYCKEKNDEVEDIGYGDWCEEKQQWQFNGRYPTIELMLSSFTNKSYEEAIENNFVSFDDLVVSNTFGDLFPPREVKHDHITRVMSKREQMRLKEFYSLPENKKKMDDFFAK